LRGEKKGGGDDHLAIETAEKKRKKKKGRDPGSSFRLHISNSTLQGRKEGSFQKLGERNKGGQVRAEFSRADAIKERERRKWRKKEEKSIRTRRSPGKEGHQVLYIKKKGRQDAVTLNLYLIVGERKEIVRRRA